ncbi:hypothetical protein [Niveispirillum sp. KHB5.9]|uniref:hypothetical protein n=1 Tax=Niveispirillum sp. KHB5.9 TaxID=3400269 RepID=UPI003A872F4D
MSILSATDPTFTLNGAMTQADRLAQAPKPATAPADGRSTESLIGFAGHYGALLNYFDLDNRVRGDWVPFFTDDPGISMAMLATLGAAALERELRPHLALVRHRRAGDDRPLLDLIPLARRLARTLADAYRSLATPRTPLADRVRTVIEAEMGPRLRLLEAVGGREDGPASWTRLARDLGLGAAAEREETAGALETLLEAMTETGTRLLDEAAPALAAALQADDHAPQAALWTAFARTFRHAQDTLNTFPARLVDFYHDEVLHQLTRQGAAGEAIICFTPRQGIVRTSVPAGTLIGAGKDDDGLAVEFSTRQSLDVLAAQLTGIRTLLRAASPAALLDAGTVTCGEATLDQGALAAPIPLFGTARSGTNGGLTSRPASLGFCLAGPVLLLRGGSRTTTVTLAFVPPDDPSVTAADIADTIRRSFAFFRTVATGWLAVTPPDLAVDAADTASVTITLHLDADATPLVAIDPSQADDATMPEGLAGLAGTLGGQPAVAARLLPGQAASPLLSSLLLTGLSVAVEVCGLQDFSLSTSIGPVSGDGSFPVFGAPPVLGSWLGLSDSEIFGKRLTSLSLSLPWYALPQTSTGFKGWYQGYTVNQNGKSVEPGSLFDNASFTADISAENTGWWTLDNGVGRYLFATNDSGSATTGDDPGDGASGADTDPSQEPPAPDCPVDPVTTFGGFGFTTTTPAKGWTAADASLRITLTAPSYAFGDTLYPQAVVAAAQRLLPRDSACAADCARRCAPWSELVRAAGVLQVLERVDTGSAEALSDALDHVLSELSRVALTAVNEFLDKLHPEAAITLRGSLKRNLNPASGGTSALGRLWQRLRRDDGGPGRFCAALDGWLASVREQAAGDGSDDLDRAALLMQAAAAVTKAVEDAKAQGASGRPQLAATLKDQRRLLADSRDRRLNRCIAECEKAAPPSFWPNPPWLPTAMAPSAEYHADAVLPAVADAPPLTYYHLLPFGGLATVDWPDGGTVPLTQTVDQQGSLFLGLNGLPVTGRMALSLLFVLDGGTVDLATLPPAVTWARRLADGTWRTLDSPDGVKVDTTSGLSRTGLVILQLDAPATGELWLRASVQQDAERYPTLSSIRTNAVQAVWVGPGGAARLDTPLPAGTIVTLPADLPDIDAAEQPVPSQAGRSVASGQAFQAWMPERLNHKGRAIRDPDWARLALAEFPGLWQVAARGPSDSAAVPAGDVLIYLVAGPTGTSTDDPAIPTVDADLRQRVETFLAARSSAFIRLRAGNPPWVRVTVTATVFFRAVDAAAALADRLAKELTTFLSPWPSPDLGRRPARYWLEGAVAEFILGRPYVLGLDRLGLAYDGDPAAAFGYFTSAFRHDVSGVLDALQGMEAAP